MIGGMVNAGTVAGGLLSFTPIIFTGAAGTAFEDTSDDSLTGTTTIDLPHGSFLVICAAFDNESTTDGATSLVTAMTVDGNAAVEIEEWTESAGAANAGVTTWFGYYRNMTGITISSGATVSFTLASNRSGKAAQWAVFTADPDATLTVSGTVASNVEATTDPPSLNPTDAATGQCVAVHALGREGGLATEVTPDNGYSVMAAAATGGGAGFSGVGIRSVYKIAVGTGGGASEPTISGASATEWAQVACLFRQVTP